MVINADTVKHWEEIKKLWVIIEEINKTGLLSPPVIAELKNEINEEIKSVYLKSKNT